MRCAVQNSKLWVCIIGSLSVFLPKQSSRLTAQSDSRALTYGIPPEFCRAADVLHVPTFILANEGSGK